jgi:vacuolar protein sorting-associated protein VTA1
LYTQLKVELAGNEAVTEDAAAAAYIENFALKIFAQADNEDRTGKATR